MGARRSWSAKCNGVALLTVSGCVSTNNFRYVVLIVVVGEWIIVYYCARWNAFECCSLFVLSSFFCEVAVGVGGSTHS